MRTAGEIVLDAPRAALWDAMADPVALGAALPGVDEVEVDERDGSVGVRARPSTGLGVTPFALRLWVRERREREHVTIDGKGRGGESAVTFTVTLDVRDAGASGRAGAATAVAWTAQAVVLGVLGSLGQRVLPAVVAGQIEGVLRAAARPQEGAL